MWFLNLSDKQGAGQHFVHGVLVHCLSWIPHRAVWHTWPLRDWVEDVMPIFDALRADRIRIYWKNIRIKFRINYLKKPRQDRQTSQTGQMEKCVNQVDRKSTMLAGDLRGKWKKWGGEMENCHYVTWKGNKNSRSGQTNKQIYWRKNFENWYLFWSFSFPLEKQKVIQKYYILHYKYRPLDSRKLLPNMDLPFG